MSAVFTQHAIERMRELAGTQHDLALLLSAIERAASEPENLGKSETAIRLQRGGDENVYIVRGGNMRAVLTVDPATPGQMVVASVYQAQKDNAIRASGIVGESAAGAA